MEQCIELFVSLSVSLFHNPERYAAHAISVVQTEKDARSVILNERQTNAFSSSC